MITDFYKRGFDRIHLLNVLIDKLSPCRDSMVDLCCEKAMFTKTLNFKNKTFVDVQNYGINHPGFVQSEILEFCKNTDKHFDFLYCGDGLEHLKEKEAMELLESSYDISDSSLWITPLGRLWYDAISKDPGVHKSGWTPKYMETLYPGKYDYAVFWDWYREVAHFPVFMFWKKKEGAYSIYNAINDAINKGN